MKIVHLCLSCFYIDGYTYQENMLVKEHVKAGHDVLVIASTETFSVDKKISYVEPSTYFGADGAKVIRLPYRKFFPQKIMRKLRIHPKVYGLLQEFKPDVIMFHGMCGFELLTVANYIEKNPNVKFYADSHEDFNNSAKSFLSFNLLYRFFYIPIINLAKRNIDKVFYISYETKEFCEVVYKFSSDELEFFPLGGVVYDDQKYTAARKEKRDFFDINSEEIVFFQSGKFDPKKKLLESISKFSNVKNNKFRYIIAGSISDELKEDFYRLIIKDNRIQFIGWVDSDTLIDLLCMADVYVQPGSQSATMQMSLAARCTIILEDVPSHRYIFKENGFLVKNEKDLEQAFREISKNPSSLIEMSRKSYGFSKQYLDYSILAERLTK